MKDLKFQTLEPPIGGLTRLSANIDEFESKKRKKGQLWKVLLPIFAPTAAISVFTYNSYFDPYQRIINHAQGDLILYKLGIKDPNSIANK